MFAKAFVVCLLALTLPVQGVVAATMAMCGPSHRDSGSQPPAAMHAAVDGAGAALPCAGHGDGGAPAGSQPGADAHTCSVCASCGSGAALILDFHALVCPEFATTVFNTLAPTVDEFSADGPDRPPRPDFA